MNKSELIAALAEKTGFPKTQCETALNALTDTIGDVLKSGDSVTLVGFGTFAVSERAARTGRNPRTGESIKIEASKSVKFSAGKAVKDKLSAPDPKAKKKK